MAYDAEHVGKALLARLQAALPGELDTVETEWAGDDPVTLADPATWFEGHKPTVLEMASDEFPFVATIVALRTPEASLSRWGYQERTITAFVDYFVVADDEETVNKRTHRYAQAIVAVLQGERVMHGYQQQDYEPEVRLSEASRHARTANADMFVDTNVDFIQAGRVAVMLEGG